MDETSGSEDWWQRTVALLYVCRAKDLTSRSTAAGKRLPSKTGAEVNFAGVLFCLVEVEWRTTIGG